MTFGYDVANRRLSISEPFDPRDDEDPAQKQPEVPVRLSWTYDKDGLVKTQRDQRSATSPSGLTMSRVVSRSSAIPQPPEDSPRSCILILWTVTSKRRPTRTAR